MPRIVLSIRKHRVLGGGFTLNETIDTNLEHLSNEALLGQLEKDWLYVAESFIAIIVNPAVKDYSPVVLVPKMSRVWREVKL